MSIESPSSQKPHTSRTEAAAVESKERSSPLKIDREKYTTKLFLPNNKWSIAEEDDRSTSLAEIDMSTLMLTDFLEGEEVRLKGEELLERAKQYGNVRMDAGLLKFFLENQEYIPPEWSADRKEDQEFPTQVYFDGTILTGRDGLRFAPYMQKFGDRWTKGVRELNFNRSAFRPSLVKIIE